MQNLFFIENEIKATKILREVLNKYQALASSNPQALRELIPSTEIWRFFVEEYVQQTGRGFKQLSYYSEYVKNYSSLTFRKNKNYC